MISCMDSIRSSLTQLVTRYIRHWRFIRRHLFGLGPITQCQRCWATRRRDETEGRTPVRPASPAHTRPNWSDSDGERRRRPPLALRPSRDPRPPAATQRALRGPRAPRKRESRDSADRAQPGPGCRLVDRPRSESGPAELPIVELIRRRRRSGPPGGRARAAQCVGRVTLQTGPGWARQPDRRADSVRERPRAEPPIVEPGPGPARARGRSAEVQAASRGPVPRPRRRAPVERRGCGPARGAGPRRPGHGRTAGTKTSHST